MIESRLKISVVLQERLAILSRKRSNFLAVFSLLYWTSIRLLLQNFSISRENDTVASLKAWQRVNGLPNLGCLSLYQLYNHESLFSNLKSPTACLWFSTPINTTECLAYFVATKQTRLIVLRNNQLFIPTGNCHCDDKKSDKKLSSAVRTVT